MSYKTLIIRLELEEAQLDERLATLMAFLQSDFSDILSSKEKDMMYKQQFYMQKYLEILRRRIAYHRMKGDM